MTRLSDIVDPQDLAQGILDGYIKHRYGAGLDLNILNYTDRAQVTPAAWDNPAVRACRGLIYHGAEDRVVARPWAKFFNHGQKEAAHIDLDEPVIVTDKMDGSLGIGYLGKDGEMRVATRGSLTSDQALHATAWLQAHKGLVWHPMMFAKVTPLFEVIYPENRIVCDYGDRDELVLLGAVNIETGRCYSTGEAQGIIGWAGSVAETFEAKTLAEALAVPPRPGAEGLVVMSALQVQALVKIKQEDYIHLHRIVTGLSERAVWERMMAGDSLEDLLESIPDELHLWVRTVAFGLREQVFNIRQRAEHVHETILADLGVSECASVSRKAYAQHATTYPDVRPYLFMLLDGKDISKAVLKSLKPAGDVRPHHTKKEAA